VIVFGRANHVSISQTHPSQLSLLPSAGQDMSTNYQPKCGDALRLRSKGGYDSFHLRINVWVVENSVILVNTRYT